jgi:hypothetical protein
MTRPYYPVSRYTRRQYRAQAAMLRVLAGVILAALLAMALFASDLARAQSGGAVARFDGGFGVQPATWVGANAANPTGGAAAANDVSPCPAGSTQCKNTPPPGRPWVIADLQGQISANGTFDVRGKGLLLAGSGNVGRNANASVILRLYCGVGTPGVFSLDSADPVPLEPDGDFRLRGQLAVVNEPLACPNAALLILNNANKSWFAAGIPKD